MKATELIEVLARAIREHGADIKVVNGQYNSHFMCREHIELDEAEVADVPVGRCQAIESAVELFFR
jgi:L-fucose mutarotase/ribose pyranase (RbsD/FucU family)